MEERKDIDRLFQESFKDFEKNPRPEMWTRIEQELNKDKKKRRVIPIWWRLGGVAALLLLFFSIALNVFDSSSDLPAVQPIVDTNEEIYSDESTKTSDSIEQINHAISDAVATKNEKNASPKDAEAVNSDEQTVAKSSYNTNTQGVATVDNNANSSASNWSPESSKISDSTDEKKEYYALNNAPALKSKGYNINNYAIMADPMPNEYITEKENVGQSQTIEEAIAAAEALKESPVEEQTIKERWSVSPVVAPVYSMDLGEGSTIHSQFNENPKSSDVTMSYGVGGSYAISKRLKLRAGVNRVDFSNSTNDVLAFPAAEVVSNSVDQELGNIVLRENANVFLLSNTNVNRSSSPEVINTLPTGEIILDYGFLEIPVAIEYRLIDRGLGVNLIGGFSTFFLNNNEISVVDFNGDNTIIGESGNINDTSYSANFGIGFDYGLSDKINIMLEPMIKYQFNTFNNTFGDVQPMFIGIYTGLNFKF